MKYFLICPTAVSEGKGGHESWTRRPEFLPSQVGNPSTHARIHAGTYV
jgi:hypothetical protein